MKKIFITIIFGVIAASAFHATPASAISLAPCPDDENKTACEKEQAEILRRWEAGEPTTKSVDGSDDNATAKPTFATELDDSEQSIGLWAGDNLLLAGNNITTHTDVKNGLLLIAGNNLQLEGNSEYGFIFGNIIKFNGQSQRDLYIAGNAVTLAKDSKIGRDVFVASGELRVETNLNGDLSVTADRVVLEDGISIAGNVNINADTIEFGKDVTVGGKLVYNDTARVNGANNVGYGELEVYHIEEVSTEARLAALFYGKFLSIAGLFLVMALILAVYSRLHTKIETETTAGRFGTNLAVGIGALIIVPIVAIFALLTVVAAPISIITLLVYGIAIYLAQGFTGLWLGYLILEKLFKVKGNPFVEVLIGIMILGLLALVPFVGVITGFVSLVLGLGLIISCVKPRKTDSSAAKLSQSKKAVKA